MSVKKILLELVWKVIDELDLVAQNKPINQLTAYDLEQAIQKALEKCRK